MSSSKIADAAYELRELSAAELAMVAGGAFIKVPPPPPPPAPPHQTWLYLGPPATP
jgi:hypothetical protein